MSSASAGQAEAQPSLLDAQGLRLPQTEERPNSQSTSFGARMQALVSALRQGDPKLAHPAFFPLSAYEQVKAIANPRRDYEKRLLAAFDRDLVELRKKLGDQADSLRWVGVEVPEQNVQWMARGKEGNRLGYFRVKRSRLMLSGERELQPIVIMSMISWRGEWYVVHLSSFK
jgi:hypothetical protein